MNTFTINEMENIFEIGRHMQYMIDFGNIKVEDSKDAFVVESKEGQTRIPYEQIYYIEAREKKLFLRLENKEVAFYDTLENLLQVLPANFLRCHRSFVVNKYYIEKVQLSQSMIWLSHGISVPLSRSCKPEFKDLKLL